MGARAANGIGDWDVKTGRSSFVRLTGVDVDIGFGIPFAADVGCISVAFGAG